MPRPRTFFLLALAIFFALAAVRSFAGESWPAVLFFPDERGGLLSEKRVLEATGEPRARALALMEALLAGPESEGLLKPLPEGAGVRTLFLLPEGLLVLDLDKGPFDARPFGAVRELGCLRAIVITLTRNIPEVTSVKVLLDGAEADTLAGHISTLKPLRPADLISGEPR